MMQFSKLNYHLLISMSAGFLLKFPEVDLVAFSTLEIERSYGFTILSPIQTSRGIYCELHYVYMLVGLDNPPAIEYHTVNWYHIAI